MIGQLANNKFAAERPKKRKKGSKITPREDAAIPIIEIEEQFTRETKREAKREADDQTPKSGSWVGFDFKLREQNTEGQQKKKKPRPRSARGLRRDLLKESIPRSSSDILHEKPLSGGRMASLPSTQISFHLESLAKEETISEETFLFEEEPTPRTKERLDRRKRSASEKCMTASSCDGSSPARSRGGSRLTFQSDSARSPKNESKEVPMETVVVNNSEAIIEEAPRSRTKSFNGLDEVKPTSEFPLQNQVTIPLLRETEENNEDDSEDQVTILERQLAQSQAQAQQLRIELDMTKKLLTKARRKLKEKDKRIYALEHECESVLLQ